MEELQIAKTIVSQIMANDKWALGCYAAQKLETTPQQEDFQGGLKFQCNGYNVKGYTTIQLHWNDTYTISFYNRNKNLIKIVEGVYCDQLVEVLDFIEKQEEDRLTDVIAGVDFNINEELFKINLN
jgi:hypothetical protein